jgi:hypothetical protein
VTYKAGTVLNDDAEIQFSQELPSDAGFDNDAHVPKNSVSLTTIREIAKQRLHWAYSLVYGEIFYGGLPCENQRDKNGLFSDYYLLKSFLQAENDEYFTRLEQDYKARAERFAARCKAHYSLKKALERLEDPEVAPLLDTDDRDVLTRAAAMLVKIEPDFSSELATAFE